MITKDVLIFGFLLIIIIFLLFSNFSADKKLLNWEILLYSGIFSVIITFTLIDATSFFVDKKDYNNLNLNDIFSNLGKKEKVLFYLDYSGSGNDLTVDIPNNIISQINYTYFGNGGYRFRNNGPLSLKEFYKIFPFFLFDVYSNNVITINLFGFDSFPVSNKNSNKNFRLPIEDYNEIIEGLIFCENLYKEQLNQAIRINNNESDLTRYDIILQEIIDDTKEYFLNKSSKYKSCDIFIVGDLFHDNNKKIENDYYKNGNNEIDIIKEQLITLSNLNIRVFFIQIRKKNFNSQYVCDVTKIVKEVDTSNFFKILDLDTIPLSSLKNYIQDDISINSNFYLISQNKTSQFSNSFTNLDTGKYILRFENKFAKKEVDNFLYMVDGKNPKSIINGKSSAFHLTDYNQNIKFEILTKGTFLENKKEIGNLILTSLSKNHVSLTIPIILIQNYVKERNKIFIFFIVLIILLFLLRLYKYIQQNQKSKNIQSNGDFSLTESDTETNNSPIGDDTLEIMKTDDYF